MAFPWSSSIFPLLIIFPGTISYRKILELRISEEFQAEFQYRRKMENLHPGKSHNRLESGSSLILAGNSLPSTFCSVFGEYSVIVATYFLYHFSLRWVTISDEQETKELDIASLHSSRHGNHFPSNQKVNPN
ncbi:uncharacterized protein LOC143862400 isoform X1 [Tasmannia lanceolata]|uniref:uncharacterized protein LOC143862400 isoform X1 n=1 Tax=Tasmannia lanceolata TaxID=3420 RepID=UPI0040638D57